MDATAAERQKRFRERQKRHRAGDHSLCASSKSCTAPAVAVTADAVTSVTRNEPFGSRGMRLWADMAGDDLTGGRRVLVEEACRIADRLDRLDGILNGDPGEWMHFRVSEDGAEVTVTLDKALAESRQQATALKQIVAELRQGAAVADGADEGGGVLDQLAARRQARLANAAGS